mmetsp:Transcript_32330/g.36862  ORF Transcript_32330/g.36862 Transcript_32330/m.36862 type:complete len:164 (-) Transcript_32330:13-504(-)
MAKKNSKAKYKKMHKQALRDYEAYRKKLDDRRENRKKREAEKSFKQKLEERMEQKGRLVNKQTNPVVGSKIKQLQIAAQGKDRLAEQFKEMKLDRALPGDRGFDESSESDEELEEEKEVQDQEMTVVKKKSKRQGKAYRKMVKSALKKAAKGPILVKRKMEVD